MEDLGWMQVCANFWDKNTKLIRRTKVDKKLHIRNKKPKLVDKELGVKSWNEVIKLTTSLTFNMKSYVNYPLFYNKSGFYDVINDVYCDDLLRNKYLLDSKPDRKIQLGLEFLALLEFYMNITMQWSGGGRVYNQNLYGHGRGPVDAIKRYIKKRKLV